MSDTTTLPADVLERAAEAMSEEARCWDVTPVGMRIILRAALPILIPAIEAALLDRIIADMHRIDRQSEMDEVSAAMRDDYLRSFLPEEVIP